TSSAGAGLVRARAAEHDAGMDRIEAYQGFAAAAAEVKRDLREFLIGVRRAGKRVAAYGAAAKGTILLNYCRIGSEFVDYVVDRSPYKQGLLVPGVHQPVYPPDHVIETKPDYLLVMVWNWREEIIRTMSCIRNWGGRFIIPIPRLEVVLCKRS